MRTALEKELAGDNPQREVLLRQALDQSPKNAARIGSLAWSACRTSGRPQRKSSGRAAHDKRLAEYDRRRDAAGPNVGDQTALARWCRRNCLDDQQRVHWLWVLQLQPDNVEAIQSLGLKPYRGMMLTPTQIERFRLRLRRISQAADRWRPRVEQWLAGIERGSAVMPPNFCEKLCKISDPCEMLGLERTFWQQVAAKGKKQEYHRMVLAIMLALADNPSPAAAEALARSAVFSEFDDVRAVAIDALKRRPLGPLRPAAHRRVAIAGRGRGDRYEGRKRR